MLKTLFSALSLILGGLETVTFSDATICEFQGRLAHISLGVGSHDITSLYQPPPRWFGFLMLQ